VFRNRPPDKLPHPSSRTRSVLQNTAFRAAAISQKRISCETSFKSESARYENEASVRDLPEKSESARCENEAFVRVVPQNLKAADVKAKLSCETSIKI
jgi:flagella basal body P-ring formation protein FlgA